MAAHAGLGLASLLKGEFVAARDHFEQASPRLEWGQCDFYYAFYPSFGAWALWVLGYADQALKWNREALDLAKRLSRPAPIANALHVTAALQMYMRESGMARQSAGAANPIAREYGTTFELSYGSFTRGWALAQQGHLDEGLDEMRRAAQRPSESGFAARPRWFVSLAETCVKSEGPEEALKLIAEGMALMERTGERWFESELYRVKGELLLMQQSADPSEAEHCLSTAIEIARRQAGRSLELRATTSLARLLASQGHREEARSMLAEIYNWFTEGLGTADLKDAKALLDELSG
jgi:adenylate cyclase